MKEAHSVLGDQTELVIDGHKRSAGTFAAIAFQLAQNDHVRLAHHMHAVGPLLAAARRKLPILVVVREPQPTILSAFLRDPRVTPRQWLKTYADFYESLAPYRDRFVVATFEEVTSDFGAVTRRVNDRFETAFRGFEHTPDNVQAVFGLIDERTAGRPWQPHLNLFISGLISADEYRAVTEEFRDVDTQVGHRVAELRVSRPSRQRETPKQEALERYLAPGLDHLRRRAEHAYRAFAYEGVAQWS
jgi:hypothetical protein